MGLKILSDFDGVWTDPSLEAQHVLRRVEAECARLAALEAARTRAHFAAFEQRVRAEPAQYGWAPDGRITSYVDEDPFAIANGIVHYIERAHEAAAALYRDAILGAGHATLHAFADACFVHASERYRAAHPPPLVADTKRTIEELWALGAELVVVSNARTEKIVAWLGAAGVEVGAQLRVVGSAGKQVLGPGGDSIEVGGRAVGVDRPRYREILARESPDLVVGDVFSLDLALPHAMRAAGHPSAPRELVLRRHGWTPAWILNERAAGAIDRVIDDVAELVDAARALLASDGEPSVLAASP